MEESQKQAVRRIHPEYEPEEAKVVMPAAQLNLFTGQPEVIRFPVEAEFREEEVRVDEGISLVKSGDTSQLIVSGYGAFLSKVSERLTVKKGKKIIYEFPFFRLSEVTVASKGVTLSSNLIMELCERGIQINFLHGTGKPYAKIVAPALTATVQARREQILALNDERSAKFSRLIVEAKVGNQMKLLRYFGKYLKTSDPERFEKVDAIARALAGIPQKVRAVKGKDVDEIRGTLMGLEGTAGRLYWGGVKEIISQKAEFMGRVHRGATDTVNALLNYGYGILYTQVWGAVITAGLEPFVGFLHVDRPGKPSLVLDLVEEFRQPVVDRTVIANVNMGQKSKMEGGLLDAGTRKEFSARVLERLESRETYRGKKYQIRSIIQIQARSLASFLRGDGKYRPFRFKW
jgi:CRISPR-associated protein Cas1